ncbi:Serine/threonine protein kinase [Sporothrix stenoceras]|uniref:Autophagy-related protein 1 n=1 Tax=Sporothrix stenoceras TaxID=5173 RepID=A0ABR3Z411_9PEZI
MQNVLASSGLPTPPASPQSFDHPKCAPNSFFTQPQQQSIRTHQQQRYVPVAPADRIGTYLGNLQLTGIIGTGAYGVVYEAVDVKTRARYAVKALSKLNADGTPLEPRQIEYQTREIRLHYSASAHPNVVSMHKIIDIYPDCLFVVLEYCAEGDLFYNITECGHFVGKDELARKVFLQILDAVHFLHSKGIYHRDLKPENILVADRGETLKLADFGLATSSERSEDYGCGSTFYMSPECLGQNATSKRPYYYCAPNDVWSLGVILVNLTCGRNPWKQASTEDSTYRAYSRNPRFLKTILPLSDELDDILARIFAINPDQRITLPELKQRILACPRFTVSPQEQAAAAQAQAVAQAQAAAHQQFVQQQVYESSPSDYAIVDDEDDEDVDEDDYDEVDTSETSSVFDSASAVEDDQALTPASSVHEEEVDDEFVEATLEDIEVEDCPSPCDSASESEASLIADDDEDSDIYEYQEVPEIVTPPPPSVAVHPPPSHFQAPSQVQFQPTAPQFQPAAALQQQQCLPPVPNAIFFEGEDAAMLCVDNVAPAAFHHHQQHQQFLQQQQAPIYHFTDYAQPAQVRAPAPATQLPLPPPPPQQAPISQASSQASGSKFFSLGVWDWMMSKNAAVQGHLVQPLQQHMQQHMQHNQYHHQQAMHQQQQPHHHHVTGFHHPMPMFNMQGCY